MLVTGILALSSSKFLLTIHYFIRTSLAEINSPNNFGKQMGKKYTNRFHTVISEYEEIFLEYFFLYQVELYYSVKNSYCKKYRTMVVLYNLAPFSISSLVTVLLLK